MARVAPPPPPRPPRASRASRPRREPVAPNDGVWLQDSPTNLMVINAVYTTDHITLDAVREIFQRRVIEAGEGEKYPRFTKRVVKVRGRNYWEEVPDFDIARHIFPAPLQSFTNTAELQDYIGSVADAPLPRDRPLWQIQYVEHIEDDGSAFIIRVHHCMGDGIAMVPILFALMDERERMEQTGELLPSGALKAGSSQPARSLTGFQKLVMAPLVGPFILIQRLIWKADRHLLHGPKMSGRKRVAWTRPLDLGVIKAVKTRLDATVNDVLMGTVAGGFARYFARVAGAVVPMVRVSMPMNVRDPRLLVKMENKFAAVLLDLPLGSHTARERIQRIKQKMDAMKKGVEPIVIYGVVNALLYTLPAAVSRTLIDFLANKCTMVVTNVPGPQGELTLGGRRLRHFMFWVPQRADIGVGVSILSFGGRVQIGVIADLHLVPDLAHVIAALEEEFEAIKAEHGG